MAMVDMKEVESDGGAPVPYNINNCPVLYLSEEQCEALGISPDTKAGTEIGIQAIAVVTRATQSIDEGEPGEQDGEIDIAVTLEIRHMSVGGAKSPADAAKTLYEKE
jgi:hypothetical protein